ncbi:LCP family protein [Pseudonocardia kujensis]|uniref:LCP family protein n=1 Tax=Pseudonocardia kujensis TaxID=1128675 RepID=UPI001E50B248|nr:LCP family protein [Pseudonocardia kujensis]MCE0768498.1 LCP family protein [Pseudonocardia kujensis]
MSPPPPRRTAGRPGAAAGPPRRGRAGRRFRWFRAVLAITSVLVLVATGYAWTRYHDLDTAVRRSGALNGLASGTADQNILVMGLDSRLDENGDPLPPALYDALDAGTADNGGHNANVLMLVHLPAGGGPANAVSVPRDDYVDLPGAPDGVAKGKIKQAYGLAYDQEHRSLTASGVTDPTRLEQASRDAGRNAEITTVSQFLAVPVDHFVEVTMVAFYQIAQVVQPITVCVDEDTQDDYSGANFHQGYQQIDAAQAVAFVRQRRDYVHPGLNFTDLDRERRQQAFIASLAYQLRQAGTFTDPTRLDGLLAVARQNTAIDPGLDLLSLLGHAGDLASGNISFTTLPVDHFGQDPAGEDVNIVDPATVRRTVQGLFADSPPADSPPAGSPPAGSPPSGSPPSDGAAAPAAAAAGAGGRTVDITNANGRNGLAATAGALVTPAGYQLGQTDDASRRGHSTVDYAAGDQPAAAALANLLGIRSTTSEPGLPSGHLHVILGADYVAPTAASTPPPAQSPTPAAPAPPGPGSGSIVTGGIPCVK